LLGVEHCETEKTRQETKIAKPADEAALAA
jgi:hypothetical protein